VTLLERAVREADEQKLGWVGSGARHALGTCKGGAEGERLVAEALQRLTAEGVKDPVRLLAIVAPGFGAKDLDRA
jgi:hypothetical protein